MRYNKGEINGIIRSFHSIEGCKLKIGRYKK